MIGQQFFACGSQPIVGAAGGTHVLDDADFLQLAQPLREQRRRHPRHATPDFVEARPAAQQLAHYQRRPALAEDLGGARDWAELSVIEHA